MTAPTQSTAGTGTEPVPFVDLRWMHDRVRDEVEDAVRRVMDEGAFILGEEVAAFEEEMAAYCEVPHAIGVDSGTSALELIVMAYGLGPGDEVITAANTFIATALAISYVGATPVLVDVDPRTYNLDPLAVEAAITPRTKAIMPVHLYGHPADMAPLRELADAYDLPLIEDASQAHGARYRGERVGSLGDVAAFSLYPAKNLGAYGDAGVVVTGDDELAAHIRLLRNYGSSKKYHHEIKGQNRRLDNLQAAILRIKLRRLDEWNELRRTTAREYDHRLRTLDVGLPPSPGPGIEPVYHLYVITTAERDALQRHLQATGISTVIHYPIPIHLQPAYADLGLGRGAFPVTERLADEILSVPMFPGMSTDQVERVVEAISSFPE